MNKLIKIIAALIALGGAVGLGFLLELAATKIQDTFLGLLLCVVIIIAGGGLLIAAVIMLWAHASGDLERSKQPHTPVSGDTQDSDEHSVEPGDTQ